MILWWRDPPDEREKWSKQIWTLHNKNYTEIIENKNQMVSVGDLLDCYRKGRAVTYTHVIVADGGGPIS